MVETALLLHGFTQTGRSWASVRAAMAEPYPRLLAPDLRGHGAAATARPVGFDAVVADLAALAPPRVALCGYSMGGRLALLFALAHPERVMRLVLVSTTAGIEDEGQRAQRRAADEALAASLERDGLEAFATRWAAQPLFAGQSPEVAAAAHADRLRNEPAGLAAALRGLGTGAMTPVWERLGELTMPSTVLAGERDERYVALGRRLAGALPSATLELVPGAGHALHLEAPGVVAAALR